MVGISITITRHNIPAEIERDVEKLEQELAYRIVDEARTLIDSSTPSGRVYRRGSIKGRRTKQGIAMGLRASGRTRMITGSKFHRASAPGQPPAEDTGKTYRDIRVSRMARGSYRIRFGGAAGYLEFGTSVDGKVRMKPRPYILKAIEIAANKVFNGSIL